MTTQLSITDSIRMAISNSQRELVLKLKELKRTYTDEMVGRMVQIKERDYETHQEFSDYRLRSVTGIDNNRGRIIAVDVVDGTLDGMCDEDYRHLFNGSNITFNPTMDLGRVYVSIEFTNNTDDSTSTYHFNEYEFDYL